MDHSHTAPGRFRDRLLGGAVLVALAVTGAALMVVAAPAALAATLTTPPPLTVLTQHGPIGQGDLFVTPTGQTATYANGAEILDRHNRVVWFHQAPAGLTDADFRTQRYDGRPVLTFWEGTNLGGLATGTDYIYDDHYHQIGAVEPGNGLSADGHEFLITPQNTALVLAYTTATADLTSIGGPANQKVIDGVVQEVDIRTGKVLFSWNSADHVPYSQSEQPLPAAASIPWDWFHVNAVHLDRDGNLLIDARNTWTTYKVSHTTGQIIWQLGGKASSFTLAAAPGQQLDDAGEIFTWQHDPEAIGHDEYTVFDNESTGTPEFSSSRAVTVKLDEHSHVATLESSVNQPEGLLAPSQGNAQTTGDGNLLVGWGALPYVSEFDRAGQLVFNAAFPAGVNTYRAYLLPWHAAGSHEDRGAREARVSREARRHA